MNCVLVVFILWLDSCNLVLFIACSIALFALLKNLHFLSKQVSTFFFVYSCFDLILLFVASFASCGYIFTIKFSNDCV